MVEIKDNDDSARQKDLISHKKYIPNIMWTLKSLERQFNLFFELQ